MASTSHGIQVVERERVAEPRGEAPPEETTRTAVGRTETGRGQGAAATDAPVGNGTVPALGIGTLGVLTLLTAAWGGIVPFVGPLFGYSADGATSWQWNLMHALLWVAPGAVACAMALAMLGMVPRALRGLARAGAFTTGMITVVCGAWFVFGPAAWPVFERSGGVFVPAGARTGFEHVIGYSFGPGVLLVLFGALAMGMAGQRRRVVVAERRAPAGRRHVWHRPVTA